MRYNCAAGIEKRGFVPRFVVVRTVDRSEDRTIAPLDPLSPPSLAAAFERVASALPYDPEFDGLEIVASTSRRQGRSLELTLVIDRPGEAVDLAVCERVAGRVNRALDAFSDPYTLDVQSAGLDRPLLRPADFERFRDRDVRVVTTLAIENRKTHRGTLLGVRGNAVVLRSNGTELPIPLELVKSANVDFDIRADLTRAKREKNARKSR